MASQYDQPLVVRDLHKTYRGSGRRPGFEAVKGISFEVKGGECFGLLGPNGAGKSTTINCITGFFPATKGEVLIEGHNVYSHPKAARLLLGVCSQEETLDTDFTAFDQMVRHATFFRIPVTEARRRTEHLLQRFGLEDKKNELVEHLSGGMKRRLQVARALVSHPHVLVLDEPTTGLDPEARRILWEILMDYRSRGLAILLCTHYMDEAERLCDRVAVIHQGRILDVDTPQDLIQRHIGEGLVEEEIKPGMKWTRPPNLEDVFLKMTGTLLHGAH